MKKILLLSLFILASCVPQTRSGVTAALISDWKDTISGVVDNSVKVEKTGEACSANIVGIFAFGDSSIETAMKNGGLEKLAYADTNYFSVFGIFQKGCTVAKGQ